MKISYTLLLCLLLVGAAIAPAGSAVDCTTANNPFLAWASAIDSTLVLSSANTAGNYPICNELWSTSGKVGTCCNVDKFKAIFEKRMLAAKDKWQGFFASLYRFKTNLPKIKAIAGTDTTTQLDAMRTDTTKYDLDGLSNTQTTDILAITQNMDTRLAAFKTDAKTCFDEAVKVRSKVFCHGCWAYGGPLFTANTDSMAAPNFELKTGTCNTVITACASTWKFVFDVQATMNVIAQIARKRMGGTGDAPANSKQISNKLTTKMADVKTAVDACASTNFAVTGTCQQTNLDTICQAFFSWAGNERIARELKPEPNQSNFTPPPARLLQTATSDDSSTTTNAAGGDLAMTLAGPTTTATVDASAAGNDPAATGSNARVFGVVIALLALCLSVLA